MTLSISGATINSVTYEPDMQDVLIGDAEAFGGRVFVEQVQEEATAYADEEFPWDGRGDEPPERHSAWLACLWQLVDARRAELVGTTISAPSGGTREVSPARCPDGHPLRTGGVLVGWSPCRCGGHRSWRCCAELDGGSECGATVHAPEPGEGCRMVGIG